MNRFLLSTLSFIITSGCALSPGGGSSSPGQVLQAMRADTNWVRHLDSLSQTALGLGARCLDPVSHTFSYEGRTWLFNQHWGGVLEIPSDYSVEDDPIQAELSFHRTRAFSPDSLILVSFYAGFQSMPRRRKPNSWRRSRRSLAEACMSIWDNNRFETYKAISWMCPHRITSILSPPDR